MNIDRALSDVAEIRAQLDKTTCIRGFRSAATGFSALIVLVGAAVQSVLVAEPLIQIDLLLTIWLSVAVISSILAGAEMVVRGFSSGKPHVWKTHRNLIVGLTPALIVGSVLTLAIAQYAFDHAGGTGSMMWALPGVWAMTYGLGVHSCRIGLPRSSMWVAGYYIAGGAICLFLSSQTLEFSARQMVLLFGLGQTMLGFVLFWKVERANG